MQLRYLALSILIIGAALLIAGCSATIGTPNVISDQPPATAALSYEGALIATINAAPTRPPVTAVVPTAIPEVAAVPAESNLITAAYDPSIVSTGESTFLSTCSACHGMDAHGITGLGKDLVNSEFIHGLSDQDLLTFIKTGRPIWDANNTTGVDMPAKGGNPALADDQILAIIAYLRTLATGG